jgi:hypothetical protein
MLYVFKELPEITKSIKDGVITRHMYYDYILTCHKLADKFDDFEKPKWKLKNAQDIKNYHDEMAYIYNMKTDEAEMRRSEEAFKQVKDNWNDFLYEEDEFSVIAPKKAMDIAREGIVLNHCVKTYLEDVLEGKTNILFIRNTEEIDKPFYTLEVKDGAVRQCHGFCNCNVSETEGLQEFLERYCKEKHIELEDTDRVLAVE